MIKSDERYQSADSNSHFIRPGNLRAAEPEKRGRSAHGCDGEREKIRGQLELFEAD